MKRKSAQVEAQQAEQNPSQVELQKIIATETLPVSSDVVTTSSPAQIARSEKTTPALTPKQITLIRAQAKSTLRIVFLGEYAFFQKHKRYTTDLKAIGYIPTEGTKFTVKFGFLDAFNSNQNIANESADRKNSDVFIKTGIEYALQAQEILLEKTRGYCQMGCGVTTDKFEAIAAANLDNDDDLDLWTINERKEIIHVFDDLAP